MTRSVSETEFAVEDVLGIEERLERFLEPYLRLLARREQREHASIYVNGRLRQLPRRTTEPIATERGKKRRPLQHFVGAGKWNDAALRSKMCRRVAAEMGSADGVLILDGSGFQKGGPESVGTQRQWCGRLGKEEQCQVAEFLVYASRGSVALVDCELYLPKVWANDKERRARCHVPKKVTFKTGWQLAAQMVFERGGLLPHRWVVGDENYGRPTELRDLFFEKDERYVLEVPCDAKVRLACGGDWTHADTWADALPERAWEHFTTRDGEKGPIHVRAVKARVYTPRASGKGRERPEILVVVRNDRGSKTWTYLASDTQTKLKELVRVGACRHGIEQALNMSKGDVGLDEYELRSWVGWHHHMTLSMLSLWFLVCEHRRIKKTLLQSPSLRSAVRSLSQPSSH
jgi:SRSO17 transposase